MITTFNPWLDAAIVGTAVTVAVTSQVSLIYWTSVGNTIALRRIGGFPF